VSHDLSERFRDLAEQYSAVLEHWRIFWERINAEDRDVRRGAASAWEKFRNAFIKAAQALGELRQAVPEEVADLWMGFSYSGPLYVREALDGQADFFKNWLRQVTEAEDVHWIWTTDFHRYMEWLERDRYDLIKAARTYEDWHRKQEAEAIARLLEQPDGASKVGEAAPAEAVTTRLENPSATREETAQSAATGDVPNDKGDYVPASTIYQDRFRHYEQFRRWLNTIPESQIRRYKPRPNRLLIHIGDWHNYWRTVDEEAWKRINEVEARQKTPRLDRNKAGRKGNAKLLTGEDATS